MAYLKDAVTPGTEYNIDSFSMGEFSYKIIEDIPLDLEHNWREKTVKITKKKGTDEEETFEKKYLYCVKVVNDFGTEYDLGLAPKDVRALLECIPSEVDNLKGVVFSRKWNHSKYRSEWSWHRKEHLLDSRENNTSQVKQLVEAMKYNASAGRANDQSNMDRMAGEIRPSKAAELIAEARGAGEIYDTNGLYFIGGN